MLLQASTFKVLISNHTLYIFLNNASQVAIIGAVYVLYNQMPGECGPAALLQLGLNLSIHTHSVLSPEWLITYKTPLHIELGLWTNLTESVTQLSLNSNLS